MENQVTSYRFNFADGQEEVFGVKLDALTLELLLENPPPWTRLDVHRCSNCSLRSSEHSYCPAALSIVPLVTGCGDIVSFDEVEMRHYRRTTRLEKDDGPEGCQFPDGAASGHKRQSPIPAS